MSLAGLRVLDLTRYIPGPYATMMLADLGADVVKVEEPPMGDATRGLPPAEGDDSAAHAALNRNKRSVLLDLRTEAGARAVRRLAGRADVFVEAFRPGVLARRGLGPDPLLADNPRLVYCSITGFGEGPNGARAGHDIGYLSRAGFLGGNTDDEGRPVLPIAQVADMAGAQAAVIGILAALQSRERTGRGQHVEVPLAAAARALMTLPLARLRAGAQGADELTGGYACYNVYRCRDGKWLSVGALEPKFWESLCRALGRPELVGRQWDGGERGRQVAAALAGLFATRDRDDWVRELAPADACVEPVLDPAEVTEATRDVVRLSATPASERRAAPALGAHTEEVLLEAGFAPGEIDALRPSRVVA